jgi:hypothetical protein
MRADHSVKYENVTMYTMNYSVVNDYFLAHPPQRKGLTVFFQHEHNLYLSGPGVWGLSKKDPLGEVESILDPAQNYYVRIVNRPRYYYSDVVVEYNRPNIENIARNSALPPEVLKKVVYAPSLPFAYSNQGDRTLSLMTNFNDNNWDPRRGRLSARLLDICPEYKNVTGVYDYEGLRDLYSSVRIMVNAHQEWFRHSIEEFRVLPALSLGCIVVSEDVPLRQTIPYHEYIVWAPFKQLAEVTADVLANYDQYCEKIHGKDSGLPALLEEMKDEFAESMTRLLADDEYFGRGARMRRRGLGLASKVRCTIGYRTRKYFDRLKTLLGHPTGLEPPSGVDD